MKKIIVCLILVVASITIHNKIVEGYVQREFKIEWTCINIDIPINGNFNDYKDNYIINVYVDGVKQSKDKYYVMLNQNGTSISTVNTSKVGLYRIGARVELYEYNASSENYINYKVIDNIPPKIEMTTESITTRYGEKPDYNKFVVLEDNSNNAVKLTVKDSHVNYNQIGDYEVELIAEDEVGQTNSIFVDLFIVDIVKPLIKLLKPVKVSVGSDLKVEDYLKAEDHYDGDLTKFIVVENLSTSSLGEQYVYVSVEDFSGNEARMLVKVEVVDDVKPIIKFNTNDARIDVSEDITFDRFKLFLLSVTDNHSIISIDDVDIDFSLVLSELGSYSVFYSVTDEAGNESTTELIVRVVQMDGPIITCTDIVIGKNEIFQENSISDYINVYDPYDVHAANTMKVDMSGVNIGKPGVYLAVVTAVNSSGIVSTQTLKITVEGSNSEILKYWPLTLIAIGPLGYFVFTKVKEYKTKKYE